MGLHKIISLRGGLAQVKTPGLAAAAFYRVLVNSTLLLSPPPLPFVALSGQNASEIENHLLLGTMNLVNRLNVHCRSKKINWSQCGFPGKGARVLHATEAV
ncbi:hypothetical protein CBS147343_6477 [Aspergillus niger]|nr:hypothetical protein CBS133816_5033 [Aspergillus niger]KAI2839216.1 hypothetical protein CBS11350_7695 [Aspergillus niger]KAI2898057.1 hypothetical protein CBS13152_2836 [Aspergillus niger]KAI2948863.1 hypothetical protein CBS147321_2310 [Aspergillus niger]KAI2975549.1 hypothetical protein CBS147324_2884 [Aspergillus niger]